MSEELEFSIMTSSSADIQPLLDQFEAEHHIRTRLRLFSWDTAWSDLVKVALYSDGPDVSEVGSTWLGDLVAMNALRPFSENEVETLGKDITFIPSAWQGTRLVDQSEIWAIPWFTGARLLYYRSNLLEEADIDEQTAFQNAEQLEHTLGRLQASGVRIPWTVPTGLTHTTLLNCASWVWGAGGDFITPDGKRTLFSRPPALAGLRAYFALGRFLDPSVHHLNGLQPDNQFLESPDTALTISGPWLFGEAAPALKKQIGIALPPGASFVGGSHLIVWKATKRADAALELIRFLTQTPAQVAHSQSIGLMPATLNALASPPYSIDPLWQMAIQGLKTGRSFPVTRSWGLMEDRLTSELSWLWADVLNNPALDLSAAIAKRLEPLAKRLDLVLGQT